MQKVEFERLVTESRSCRRFDESYSISIKDLEDLVDMARKTPSAANLQPLKYKLVCEDSKREVVAENIFWAGYLKDWDGPKKGERPSSYIIICIKKEDRKGSHWLFDAGISAQTIMLGAKASGLGGCMIASFNEKSLVEGLSIDDSLEPVLVLAIGKPVEEIVLETAGSDIKYWRDDKGVHHVPKRSLSDIII